jgi:hypothetical protein
MRYDARSVSGSFDDAAPAAGLCEEAATGAVCTGIGTEVSLGLRRYPGTSCDMRESMPTRNDLEDAVADPGTWSATPAAELAVVAGS